MRLLSIIGFLILVQYISGQVVEQPLPSVDQRTRLNITGFSYPIFLNEEEHKSFLVRYNLSKSLKLDLQGFYDTYRMTNRIRRNLVGKWYVSDRLYLFSGIEVESEVNKYQELGVTPPRVGFISGVGYEIRDNFMIEAKSNIQLNSSPMGAYGEYLIPIRQAYTLGGKFKF